jgi:hypothetical protein
LRKYAQTERKLQIACKGQFHQTFLPSENLPWRLAKNSPFNFTNILPQSLQLNLPNLLPKICQIFARFAKQRAQFASRHLPKGVNFFEWKSRAQMLLKLTPTQPPLNQASFKWQFFQT